MAKKGIKSISAGEWVLMDCVWGREPVTVTEIADIVAEKTGWAKSTTKTLISRLVAKGYLRFEEGGKARKYYPAVTRSDAALLETENFLARLYDGSLGMLVNTLVDQESLSSKDIEELRAILDKGEGRIR